MSWTIWRPRATLTCAISVCVILRARTGLRQRFDDRAHVADRHALGQQALHDAHDDGERQHLRHQLVDELRRGLREALQQLLRLFVAEQLVRVRLDQMREMRRDHRGRVDHGVAERLRVLAHGRLDPHRFHAERRDRASRGR